jgi:hypothetical protein
LTASRARINPDRKESFKRTQTNSLKSKTKRIAEILHDTTSAFIESIEQSLLRPPRPTIVWRYQSLLGGLSWR